MVNQTISGLACGKPIKGHVAFLGGPLHFMPELKNAFIRTLRLDEEHIIDPPHSHLFAAVGAALNAKQYCAMDFDELLSYFESEMHLAIEVERLEPLFKDQAEYDAFIKDHNRFNVKKSDLASYKADAIWVSTPAPLPRSLRWWARTVPFSGASMITTTAVL